MWIAYGGAATEYFDRRRIKDNVMKSKEAILSQLNALKSQFGEWTYDIPLPHGIWTRGNRQKPHTRLKRIVQVVSDISRKPLSECRILDLGCLDGIFSIEFAQQGADVTGVEIRDANINKAAFCADALGLTNLNFRQDDVRNISLQSYGRFDAIICSGILYHLPAIDAIKLIDTMFEMVDGVVVIDTQIALSAEESIAYGEHQYWGSVYREHPEDATASDKAKNLWASADNVTSFWFTRESLVNILAKAGFSSVYECFHPAHLNFGRPGLEHRNRCTFVAIKQRARDLVTSPAANSLREDWPEGSLSYSAQKGHADRSKTPFKRLIARFRSLMV